MTGHFPISKYSKGVIVKQKAPIESYTRKKITKSDYPNITKFKETDFSLKHNLVKDRVLSIVREDKYARKNYFYMCLLYWIKSGQITMNVDFKDFDKITKPETISRTYRELVSMAKKGDKELQFLLKDEEVLDKREELNKLNTNYYKKTTWKG